MVGEAGRAGERARAAGAVGDPQGRLGEVARGAERHAVGCFRAGERHRVAAIGSDADVVRCRRHPDGAHIAGSDQAPSAAAAQLLVHDDAAVTVRVVLPLTSPRVALMLVVPAATPLARPAASIVATELVAEAHVTVRGQVGGRGVAVGAGGAELLGQAGRDRRIGRGDRDAGQGRRGDGQGRAAADEPEGGADAASCRRPRRVARPAASIVATELCPRPT